jgi:hypothetical protein
MGDGLNNEISNKEAIELYETGKTRRYNLLFSVNGGAFALAKVLTVISVDKETKNVVLGNLSLTELSIGLILFTLIMITDIFVFGYYSKNQNKNWTEPPFGIVGMLVILSIGILISFGWLFVSGLSIWLSIPIIVYFLIIYLVGFFSFRKKNIKTKYVIFTF